MKKVIITLITLLTITLSSFAQKDPLVGIYCGEVKNGSIYPFGRSADICAEVARFKDSYQVRFTERPLTRGDTYDIIKNQKAVDGKILLNEVTPLKLSGYVSADTIVLKGKNLKGLEIVANLKKLDFVSPTMGLKPPKNAIVLFDGKDTSKFFHKEGEPCCWKVSNGVMTSTPLKTLMGKKDGSIFTKEKFGAMRVHLEFKIPAEYDKSNTRGNSGVHFGPYEIQIIDSFGEEGNWWQCGAIYRIHAPCVNASIEPEAWQTFDIEYTPAKFVDGKLVSHPEMTVYHNGVRVQYKEPVLHPTNISFKHLPHTQEKVTFGLQDHAHPVSFRNIWVVPM